MIWIAVGAALAASARLDLAATRLLGASATIPSPPPHAPQMPEIQI